MSTQSKFFDQPDSRIPQLYDGGMMLMRNNRTTTCSWLESHFVPSSRIRIALQLRAKGYEVNCLVRFKAWK